MSLLGEDFIKAQKRWLYPREPQQNFWRAVLLAIGVFLAYNILQGLVMVAIYAFVLHGDILQLGHVTNADPTDPSRIIFLKSALLSIFPCGVITAALVIWVAQFGQPHRKGVIPIEWPKISWLGWVLIVIGFILVMLFSASGIFSITGIDPSNYDVSDKGLSDTASKAGVVEKTLADLSQNPVLFVFGALSAIIGAPLAEEFIFRGLLFAGIAKTSLGWPGAVIISAAVWAIAHAFGAPWIFVGVIFGMGIVLGLLLLRFGSLWVTIACHTAWNVLVTLPMFSLGPHT